MSDRQTAYAFKRAGEWREITGPFTIGDGDDAVQYPANWPALVSADELTALGVVAITEPGPLPSGAIIIGSTLTGEDAPTRTWTIEQPNLADLKKALTTQVNTAAGAFRLNFITDIPGQQATYLAKEAEAKRWTEDAGQGDFPYLSAESAATGTSMAAVAALVLATAEQWRALDPRIEGARRGATCGIDAAETAAEARAAAVVDWPALLG